MSFTSDASQEDASMTQLVSLSSTMVVLAAMTGSAPAHAQAPESPSIAPRTVIDRALA